MHVQAQRKICRSTSGIAALIIAAVLSPLSFQAPAAESAGPLYKSNTGYKHYYVHYEVNADGTYKELDELAMTVLTEQGVQMSKQMPIGMHNVDMDASIEIITAYTLKKSGEHIDATTVNPPTMGAAAGGAVPIFAFPKQTKFVAFPNVEVGDTLVVSYRTIQQKPAYPGNIVLRQTFMKFEQYDDAVISLSAPTSLNVRIETFGVEKGERTVDGQVQKWIWKYRNLTPVAMLPNQPPSFDVIHISSFKDNAAETEAIKKHAMASRPPVQRCQIIPGNPNDGPQALNLFAGWIADFFWHSEYALESQISDWNTPTCVLDDGRPRLSALYGGLKLAFNNEKDWSKSLARLEYLKKKFPDSAVVALAEATYWVDYAWDARGSGYASSVTQDGWKLFRERLEKAERILIETKSYSSTLPNWYDQMIVVQSALDRPEDERDKTFIEGTKRFKTFYPTYFTMLKFISPKWGGSWETVDNMVKWSVENTKATDGDSMYARLYWSASGSMPEGSNPFKLSRASWPKMKKGFEDLMARHPKSKWNLNNFARFACQAGDKNTFLALRQKIGKDIIHTAWEDNPSLDLCETKFGVAQ